MTHLSLKNISLQLGDFRLQNINLHVAAGEYKILLGPTGTGKTVLLETIAGLYPHTGQIWLDQKDITGTSPEKRNIGVVYQDYCLFPHLTVFNNIAFGLKIKKKNQSEIDQLVKEMAGFLGINHLLDRTQHHLSGGECQRVALARTLVLQPSLLLLDEPLSAVDRQTRNHLRRELQRIHRELGLAIIHVTHDLSEAFLMGDTMTVMHDGKILQDGTPEEIANKPATRLVAELLGIQNFLSISPTIDKLLHSNDPEPVDYAKLQMSVPQPDCQHCISFPDWAVELEPCHSPSTYLWLGRTTVKELHCTDNLIMVTLETRDKMPLYTSLSRREMDKLPTPLIPGRKILTGILKKGVHVLSGHTYSHH